MPVSQKLYIKYEFAFVTILLDASESVKRIFQHNNDFKLKFISAHKNFLSKQFNNILPEPLSTF